MIVGWNKNLWKADCSLEPNKEGEQMEPSTPSPIETAET